MAESRTDCEGVAKGMTEMFEQILQRTAEKYNVKPEELIRSKNHELISIRDEAIFLCQRVTGSPQKTLCLFFRLGKNSISLRIQRFESLLAVETKLKKKIQEEIGYLLLVMELHTIHGDIVLGEAKLIVLREQEKQLQGKIEKMK